MKTTKKNTQKKAVSTATKTAVKKIIESNKISQPSQSVATGDTQKQSKADKVFKYETTFPRITLTDKKEIVKLIKADGKELNERLNERHVISSEIVKISKYGHKQLLNGMLKSNSMKYYITLKNDKTICINISQYIKKQK